MSDGEEARLNITDISIGGLVTIKSNAALRVPIDANITTTEELDVWYIPHNDNPTQLKNFTVVEFNSRNITIQLGFESPLYVSTAEVPDEIVVRLQKLFFAYPVPTARRRELKWGENKREEYLELRENLPKMANNPQDAA